MVKRPGEPAGIDDWAIASETIAAATIAMTPPAARTDRRTRDPRLPLVTPSVFELGPMGASRSGVVERCMTAESCSNMATLAQIYSVAVIDPAVLLETSLIAFVYFERAYFNPSFTGR